MYKRQVVAVIVGVIIIVFVVYALYSASTMVILGGDDSPIVDDWESLKRNEQRMDELKLGIAYNNLVNAPMGDNDGVMSARQAFADAKLYIGEKDYQ